MLHCSTVHGKLSMYFDMAVVLFMDWKERKDSSIANFRSNPSPFGDRCPCIGGTEQVVKDQLSRVNTAVNQRYQVPCTTTLYIFSINPLNASNCIIVYRQIYRIVHIQCSRHNSRNRSPLTSITKTKPSPHTPTPLPQPSQPTTQYQLFSSTSPLTRRHQSRAPSSRP